MINNITFGDIIEGIEECLCVSWKQVSKKRKLHQESKARRYYYFILYRLFGYSYKQISSQLYHSKSNVVQHIRQVSAEIRDGDKETCENIEFIINSAREKALRRINNAYSGTTKSFKAGTSRVA